ALEVAAQRPPEGPIALLAGRVRVVRPRPGAALDLGVVLVDDRDRRPVAPAQAGHLAHARALGDLRLSGQPARQVVADRDLATRGGLGAVVRIEGDQALDLVERAAHVARQRHELLAREPSVLVLDRVELGDEARAGELPRSG